MQTSKRFFNSSLLKSVEIKTSWAVFPFLAIALYPFIVLIDTLIINLEALPLTLDIIAGVIVLISGLIANFWSTGIKPSIYVLWVKLYYYKSASATKCIVGHLGTQIFEACL